MTGLVLGQDKIIEIAAIITDQDLNPLDPRGFERVIHCPENRMKSMGEWCTEQHAKVTSPSKNIMIDAKSGLTARVLASQNTAKSVEQELLDYIARYVPPGEGYLAGHCVYVDRDFMRYEFPRVIDHLHWRLIGSLPLENLLI